MPLKEDLQQLVEGLPGALGAILVDWEGEAVEHASRIDDYELKVIGAYKGAILANLREVVMQTGADQLEEFVIATATTRTLVLPITHEYFLVLTLSRNEILGRALRAARECVVRLRPEIV